MHYRQQNPQMSASTPPKAVVPGLELIPPAKLAPEFRRFRHDDLYYIHSIVYYPRDEGKPCARVVALTPVAFFITDTNGNMDRATRLEYLSGVSHSTKKHKKLIGSVEHHHIVVHIPSEYDVHFSFEKMDKSETAAALEFLRIIPILANHCRGKKGAPIVVKELGADANMKEVANEKPPTGFLSPQEIIAQNKERAALAEQIESAAQEVLALKAELDKSKAAVETKKRQLKSLEQSVGVDLTEQRQRKQQLQAQHAQLHKSHTIEEIEVAKMTADLIRHKEQLEEERSSFDKLVNERVKTQDTSAAAQQTQMYELRIKAQKRELDKSEVALKKAKDIVSSLPQYEGPDELVAKALQLEEQVQAAVDKWQRDMDTSNKVEKFLAMMNSELERLGPEIAEKHAAKLALIEEREGRAKTAGAPSASPAVAVASPAPAPAATPQQRKPSASEPRKEPSPTQQQPSAPQKDDFLELAKPTQPRAPVQPEGGDDDLLGGAPPAAKAPPPAASANDDQMALL